jgi:hypothetical protein
MGSAIRVKTIGIESVAFLAARAAGVPTATMTLTLERSAPGKLAKNRR